jgi:two-component system response regulator YesN
MYNVLIIDDEEPLREAIRILGDWKSLGVERVLEASDGLMGLSMLEEHKIDLAIVDMKMPGLNGVELLQLIERDYPDLLTIVISGYNDFEYTRQAILSKVVDYLLKPVNRSDLNQALVKAFNVLEAKRLMQSEFINKNIALNMSLPKLKEKIYLSIIERSLKNQLSDAMLPLIGAEIPGNRFAAVVVRLLNVEDIGKNKFHQDLDLLHFAVANVINEVAGDRFQCFSFANPKQEREIITVITMNGGYREDMTYQSVHRMKRVAATLYELFGALVVIGMGDIRNDVMDIASSYESAKALISGVDLMRLKGSFVANGLDKAMAQDKPSLIGRFPMIRNALEGGNLQHARSIMGELTKNWRTSEGGYSIGEADRTVRNERHGLGVESNARSIAGGWG